MTLPTFRPVFLLAPVLASPLAFGAWEEAQVMTVVNRSHRTLFLTLGSMDPAVPAAASSLAPGPGQGDIVPLEPLDPAAAGSRRPARFPLGHGGEAQVLVDRPEGADQATATLRLEDENRKPVTSFTFHARWGDAASGLERGEEQPGERVRCQGTAYELLKPDPAPARPALGSRPAATPETKASQPPAAATAAPERPGAGRAASAGAGRRSRLADKENFLIGTLANGSRSIWRLAALQKGLIVILVQTGPREHQEFENVKEFLVGPGETVHLLQPFSGSKGSYQLQDRAGTTIQLAWDERACLGLARPSGGSTGTAPSVQTRDGRHRVQAEGGTVSILPLDTTDRKDQACAEAATPAAAPAADPDLKAGGAAEPGAKPAGWLQWVRPKP
jgi:hypothetical protein